MIKNQLYQYHDMNSFGESGPAADVAEHFGFTPENAAKQVQNILKM